MKRRSSILAALAVASLSVGAGGAMAASTTYQEYIDVPCSGFVCTGKFTPVPPNRRLEITHMACLVVAFSSGATGVSGATLRVTRPDDSIVLDEPLPLQRSLTSAISAVGSVETRILVRARQGIEMLAGSEGGPVTLLRCKIAGDLSTAP